MTIAQTLLVSINKMVMLVRPNTGAQNYTILGFPLSAMGSKLQAQLIILMAFENYLGRRYYDRANELSQFPSLNHRNSTYNLEKS
jgi:hypothetical protein